MIKKNTTLKLGNITQKWVDLLVPYTNGYSAKFSASELSRMTKIPQQTASRHLNVLVNEGILNYIIKGKNKLFYLDLTKEATKILLHQIESYKTLKFQLKNSESSIIINDLIKNCDSLILFGSYASGKYNKGSDLDIIIIGKFDKMKIKKIKERQTIEINEHYSSYNEFYHLLKNKNPLTIEVINNHILFGNISKIIGIFWRME